MWEHRAESLGKGSKCCGENSRQLTGIVGDKALCHECDSVYHYVVHKQLTVFFQKATANQNAFTVAVMKRHLLLQNVCVDADRMCKHRC
ncbi:hypothetical protein T4E_3041 [Trichinella pseudospiralis]|uniref:Uncharacterized protein n=1 Tax=Trichinella pseudospiralis TaxID=6337 RepID=A0A0V0X0L1_TRIPS|nr:hypothetical protein T4E_3041 [Trichinella pseudospiralis]